MAPLYEPVSEDSIGTALGEAAGANANWVFQSDGIGGGTMQPNLQHIARRITVGLSGDVDYTSIATAITAAVAGGASASTPWQIRVYPGSYSEAPMTLAPGIVLTSENLLAFESVFVVASDVNNDLFTCTGGYISGFHVKGVTSATKALFRCATPYTLSILSGITFDTCSNGIIVSNGAACLGMDNGISITGPGEGITTAYTITGAGSYLAISRASYSCISALLPYYAGNPVQTVFKCQDGAELFLASAMGRVAYKDTTADFLFVDTGGVATLMSVEVATCGNAVHIGSSGSNSQVIALGTAFKGNYLNCFNESSTGVFYAFMSADSQKYSGVTGAKRLGLFQFRDTQEANLLGAVNFTYDSGKKVGLGSYFIDSISTGVGLGGDVTAGTGLHVDVSAGAGWVHRGTPDNDSFNVSWIAVTALDITASTINYIFYDSVTSAVVSSTSAPGVTGILLATVVTDGSGIRYLHNTRTQINNYLARLHTYLLSTRMRALSSGLGVAQGSTNRKIDVSSGSYYITDSLLSYAGATDVTFSYFYGAGGVTEVASQTQLDITQYDNAGTLAAMTTDYYRSDTVILTSDGRISIIYGSAEYSSKALAEAAAQANTPSFMEPTSFPLAKIVIKKAGGIESILDIRAQPGLSSGSGGAGGVSIHALLSGLTSDDHPQYLPCSGARAMSGDLSLGTHNITTVGTVDGVTVSGHAARHNPGGADALATGTPTGVLVAATAAAGSAASYARSDHQHGLASGAPSSIGASNVEGSSTSGARLDHVHAHGVQAGGTTHADATTSVAGFMSGTDKTKLDGVATGATNTALSSTAPVNVTKSTAAAGTAVDASRQDHKHDVTTAAPASSAVAIGGTATEGTSTSLSRADHLHTVTAATPVAVGTANAAGSAATFPRSDHVHAGLTRGANDFSSFTSKTVPVAADILLIEDSAASGAKKYSTVEEVVGVFGNDYQIVVAEATSTTTSSTFQDKLTLTTGALTGNYRIVWQAEIYIASTTAHPKIRLYNFTDATELCYDEEYPASSGMIMTRSGFAPLTLAGVTKSIRLQFGNNNNISTTTCRRARIEMWRVS
jgi:hypothetical protein